LLVAACAISSSASGREVIWLEAEGFDDTGKWSNDSQHVDLMGSPYLLATGVGRPVADAVTKVRVARAGTYRLWVRCRDWLPEHSPGRFQVLVGGDPSPTTFGKAATDAWQWVDGGEFELTPGEVEVRLHDLTGWWGRCDAVVLATGGFRPSDDSEALAGERLEHCGVSLEIKDAGSYDVVVVGGGPAGLGASVAAARNGCKVALVQDRPVLDGNASSEIQVRPMGYNGRPPDKINVTGLAEEFFPKQGWGSFADSKKMEAIVRAEEDISLFLNTRATGVEMARGPGAPLEAGRRGEPGTIESVLALDVRSGQRMRFAAPLFIDCTGHGWVGYYAGAEYRMGQEAREEFGESLAPVKPGKRTMGNSLYNCGIVTRAGPVEFECPEWAYQWKSPRDFEPGGSHRRMREPKRPENFDLPSRGKGRQPNPGDANGGISRSWWVEYGGVRDTIKDAEKIRDERFRINVGLWNYAKNHNPRTVKRNRNRELVWLNYVPGVRESRRLVGDYVMSQRDYDERIAHADSIAFTDWGPDVHHPEGFWVRGNDCIHVYQGRRTSVPYRTLYSRNIGNLFMAGRCHSATHIAMGGTRVMRPCMQMGQAAGTAAAVARRHDITARGVYQGHVGEVQQLLLKDGAYIIGIPNSDPRDMARDAAITASSAGGDSAVAEVADGHTRPAGGETNAWMPKPGEPMPQWVELTWKAPRAFNMVHVTFLTDRHVASRFNIEAHGGGAWKPLVEVSGDRRRRQVLGFERTTASRLRVVILAKGAGEVGIAEIRIYDEPDRVVEIAIARRAARAKDRPAPRLTPPSPSRALVDPAKLPGIVVDDTHAERKGSWLPSTHTRPYVGGGYLHDENSGKGAKSVRFRPKLPKAGRYEVRVAYAAGSNRATNVPVTIHHKGGERTVRVNQRERPPIDGLFVSLGTFEFDAGDAGSVVIANDGTDAYVVVDAVQFVP
jgi:hypothetical protein